MQGKYEVNQINISSVSIVKASMFAGTSLVAIKEKNGEQKDVRAQGATQKKIQSVKTSIPRNPPPQLEKIEDETEEEFFIYLGGEEPLTGHFTMANLSFEEDN